MVQALGSDSLIWVLTPPLAIFLIWSKIYYLCLSHLTYKTGKIAMTIMRLIPSQYTSISSPMIYSHCPFWVGHMYINWHALIWCSSCKYFESHLCLHYRIFVITKWVNCMEKLIQCLTQWFFRKYTIFYYKSQGTAFLLGINLEKIMLGSWDIKVLEPKYCRYHILNRMHLRAVLGLKNGE